MGSHHWLMIVIAVLIGVALQRYTSVWSKVGLP